MLIERVTRYYLLGQEVSNDGHDNDNNLRKNQRASTACNFTKSPRVSSIDHRLKAIVKAGFACHKLIDSIHGD